MPVETGDFLAMLRRMLRAAGRRVAEGDEVELADLAALRDDLEAVIVASVAAWRAQGRSWSSIGDALGISKQGAQQRYGRGGK